MTREIVLVALLLYSGVAFGQVNTQKYVELSEEYIQGYSAFETTAYVEQFWRLPGNSDFDSSIFHIVKKLERAGYKPENSDSTRMTYRIERRPLKNPAWNPQGAQLWIGDSEQPLLNFTSNRNMININSHPTNGVEEFQVVWIKDISELENTELEGKVAYLVGSPYRSYQEAVIKRGAAGVITYGMADYLEPKKNQKSITFRSIPYNDTIKAFGISLSFEAKLQFEDYLKKGNNSIRLSVNTSFRKADELTIVATIKGSVQVKKELVVSCHVQEPGANDNASGVGAGIELAETYAELVSRGELDPKRTLTIIWGDEIRSTMRYLSESKRETVWGISLDMVGQNTELTGGSFLIERMPDPGAIWTRGKDSHTEWGSPNIKVEDFFPHYFNTFVENRMLEQGERADWTVKTNPFEGGSDHVPFLNEKIPGVLFWHFTDQFYHTDADRIDKVSRKTLKNVTSGTFIITATLLNADQTTINGILKETLNAAEQRLKEEFEESRKALQDGEELEVQRTILTEWFNWYTSALQTVRDISDLDKPNEKLLKSALKSVELDYKKYMRGLK